jgi:hypothetical protein
MEKGTSLQDMTRSLYDLNNSSCIDLFYSKLSPLLLAWNFLRSPHLLLTVIILSFH